MTLGPDGDIYVISTNPYEILRYVGPTGNYLGVFTDDGLLSPYSLAFAPNGDLYVSQTFHDKISRYDKNGSYLGDFGDSHPPIGLDQPGGITVGVNGELLVCNIVGDNVLRFDIPSGNFLGVFASGSTTFTPYDVLLGPDGLVYITIPGETRVARHDASTGAFVDELVTSFPPKTLTFGMDDNIYVSRLGSGNVFRYDIVTLAPQGQFMSPSRPQLADTSALLFLPDFVPSSISSWRLSR